MIREFEELRARGELEVENLIEIGLRAETSIGELREFQVEQYARDAPQHWWLEAVIRFRELGFRGLSLWLEEDREKLRFVTGLLENLKSTEAVALLASLTELDLSSAEAVSVMNSLNLIMSFEPVPFVSEEMLSKLRRFLHAQLAASDPVQVAGGMYALREIGDMASVAILRGMPDLAWPYAEARSLAMERIRKRWS